MGLSRRLQPEVMDQPGLCPRLHTGALTGLARINLLSGAAGTLFGPLAQLQRRLGTATLRVLDVATGAGDVPVRLARLAARRGLDWHLAGCDRSAVAVEHAREGARRAGAGVEFFVHDALTRPLPGGYHAVMCSLFLHHLDEEQAVRLLGAMAKKTPPPPPPPPQGEGEPEGATPPPPPPPRSGEGEPEPPLLVLVNDLNRHRLGLWLARLATRLLTRSPVVHTDGPRSVEAAYTPDEALALAARAGLAGATVRRVWPFRWLLSWSAP